MGEKAVDLEAVRRRHGGLHNCSESPGCDAIQLADEVERLRNQDIVARALVGPLVARLREALEKIADGHDEQPIRALSGFVAQEIARAALPTPEPEVKDG